MFMNISTSTPPIEARVESTWSLAFETWILHEKPRVFDETEGLYSP